MFAPDIVLDSPARTRQPDLADIRRDHGDALHSLDRRDVIGSRTGYYCHSAVSGSTP